MAVEIANAVLNITPSMRGLSGLIDREMRGVDTRRAGASAGDGYASGFGSTAKKLTGILAGAFAAVQIKDFATSAIGNASDLQEVGTKLQAVFGDAAADIEAFGDQGAKALGQTSLQARNAAATFGTFGKAAGLSAKDNAAFSTELAKLATDMASFSNTTPEEAIEALGSGLRGEAEPLRKYGVLLDDATLRQEALSMGLISSTKEALTPANKVLAANAVIMKQTADAQGDFARTSGGLANQQRILSAQWEDAKGKLGQAFLPAVTGVVSALNEKLFPALETAGTMASDAWAVLSTGDFKGGTSLGAEDSPLVNALFTARDVFADVKGGLSEAWSILTSGDFQGGNGFEEDSPLINFLFVLRDFGLQTFEKLRDVWDKLWSVGEKLWPSLVSIGESLFDAFETLSANGLTVWDLLLDAFQGIADVADKYLVPAFDWLARFMRENPQSVLTFVGVLLAVVGAVKAWAVAQAVLNAVMTANPIGAIVVAIAALAAGIVWAYNNVDWFRELVDNAWTWISEKTMWLWDNAIKPFFTWVAENIHVVGDFFIDIWNKAQPVFEFLKNSFENFLTVAKGVLEFVIGVFTGDWERAWEGIKTFFGGIWDQMQNIVTTVWGLIEGAISDAWNWIRDNVFTPLGAGVEALETFFNDLWTTVSDVWTWIQEKISTAWTWINQNVFAPMNLAINTIGTFFAGLWTTVESVWTKISNFFVNVAEGIADAVTTVKTAITDITNAILAFLGLDFNSVTVNPDGSATVKGPNVAALPFTFGRARGGIIPGSDPGRRDNMLGRLPSGQGIGLRSEEAIMVPEFTHSVGGAAGVYALNRAAESGRLGDMIGGGFARGGVIGQAFHDLISNAASRVLKGREEQVKSSASRVGDYGPENPSGLASNTAAAKAFITQMWGITNIGGWRASGSVAGSDHPKGKALDVMIANYMSAQGIAQGTSIADWFIKNPNNFGTKYVIWRDRINQNGSWSQYSHPGGNNDTLAHRDHVHLSFLTGAAEAAGRAVGDSVAGSGVERWRSLALQALAATGQPASNVDRMLNQIRTESSGDPNAQNNTDINAQRGYPSQGLLQVIRPTFEAALRGTQFANLIPLGPKDPWANMISSILYGVKRYGSLSGAYRGVAYDQGGMLAPNGIGVNLLNKPEAVLTPPQTAAYQAHARALEDGFAGSIGSIQVFLGGKEIKDELEVIVDGKLMDLDAAIDQNLTAV